MRALYAEHQIKILNPKIIEVNNPTQWHVFPKLQCNFAKWKPCHGKFKFRHPWRQYQKLGALSRQCASSMEALASYVIALTRTEVTADPSIS